MAKKKKSMTAQQRAYRTYHSLLNDRIFGIKKSGPITVNIAREQMRTANKRKQKVEKQAATQAYARTKVKHR